MLEYGEGLALSIPGRASDGDAPVETNRGILAAPDPFQ
jgi:hypothetical protein